jgi:hypothetical protein
MKDLGDGQGGASDGEVNGGLGFVGAGDGVSGG